MEEIHLKRRILEHNSELLLTWWDERKQRQEGILISCQCKGGCPQNAPAAGDSNIVVREKMNVQSSPVVSKLMNYGSGVTVYSDSNGFEGLDKNDEQSANQGKYITLPNDDFTVITPNVGTRSKPKVAKPSGSTNQSPSNEWRHKRPYPCEYCGKPFRTSYEKRRHEMIHTGKRPWKCTECSKAFVDRACLRNHMMKRHEGYKPFKCTYCDIHFFDTDSRSVHEQTHKDRLTVLKVEAISAKLKTLENMQKEAQAMETEIAANSANEEGEDGGAVEDGMEQDDVGYVEQEVEGEGIQQTDNQTDIEQAIIVASEQVEAQ